MTEISVMAAQRVKKTVDVNHDIRSYGKSPGGTNL